MTAKVRGREVTLTANVALGIAAYLAGTLSYSLTFQDVNAVPIRIGAGIFLAVFLTFGTHLWLGALAGAFAANLAATGSPLAALGVAAGSTLEALAGAWLVARYARGREAFDRPRDTLRYIMLAGLIASLVGAGIGATTVASTGSAQWTDYGWLWFSWWLANVAAQIIVAPLLLVWTRRQPFPWDARRRLELGLIFVALLALCELVFGVPFGIAGQPFAITFLFFPLTAWVAFRVDSRATVTVVALIASLAIMGTLSGRGPFATTTPRNTMFLYQAFIVLTGGTALAIAAGVAERRLAEREIASLNAELERRVVERTEELDRSEGLRGKAEAAEERARLLAEISSLLASSLDYEVTLAGLPWLTVPRVADFCAVYLKEDGGIRRVALASDDPAKGRALQAFSDLAVALPERNRGSMRVLRTGKPELVSQVSEMFVEDLANTPEELALLRSLGMTSILSVPIVSDGATIGSLTFGSYRPELRYDEKDLILAQEIAGRAAVTIEKSRLFAEVEEAVRVREEFLAVASHELRTPITSLRLQVQIVERAVAQALARTRVNEDPRTLASELERILNFTGILGDDSRRLVRLVNGLLDVTRIASGKLDLQLEDLDFRDVVRAGIDSLRPELAQSQAKLTFRAPQALPGRWDRLRLEQIVANLLSNAIRYGEGRPILVTANGSDDEVVLTVEDQGRGIAPEHLGPIFQRYQRGGSTSHPEGLGLGLYITREIVESHGGTIAVTSEVNRGTTFTVRLPRRFEAPAEPPASA